MEDTDNRFLAVTLAAFQLAGKIVLGVVILLGIRFLAPLVELVAGRTTAVDVSMRLSVSIAVSLTLGTVTVLLVRSNRRLRNRIRMLETRRKKSRRPQVSSKKRS